VEIVVLPDSESVAEFSANIVVELMRKKPAAVLGLATGSTPIALYQHLVERYRSEDVSFSEVVTFNLDEYLGLDPSNPQSYRSFMNSQLFDHVDIDLRNTHLPHCEEAQNPRKVGAAYEREISHAGGIDLQILGIGANGHIGFNEPTSSLRSRTRVKTLTERTVQDNSRLFKPHEAQPQLAMTMGIATILEARQLVLMATGESKAHSVRQAIEGPLSAMCPASALQLHENVVFILDEDAACELEGLAYYRWAHAKNQLLVGQHGYFDEGLTSLDVG